MATVPVVGTCWRRKRRKRLVRVEHVSYSALGGWVVLARPVSGRGTAVMAKAHWFTTEGYEHVADGTGG